MLHVEQDVAVDVERNRYGRMPQHLGDHLGIDVLEQQYGRGGMRKAQDHALRGCHVPRICASKSCIR